MTATPDDEADRDRPDREPPTPTGPGNELDAAEVDERFAALIANLDDPIGWPEDDAEDDTPSKPDAVAKPSPVSAGEEPTLLELWDTELPDDAEDPEETYTPPPPPPVPKPSAPAVLGVLLVLGGLALVVSPTLLDVGPELGMLTGIVAFLGGAAMLVWRLRPEPEDDDEDPDNGAIV